MKEIEVRAGEKVFSTELADNFISRAKGMSFRSSGKMLFAFCQPTSARIDMMLLSEPLYLYFMNSEKQVISVQKAEPWSWNPKTWNLYSPDQRYRYLLESFEDLKVDEGDRLEFEI